MHQPIMFNCWEWKAGRMTPGCRDRIRYEKRWNDGTTGQTTGHVAACGSASRYMACRKATRQATELTTV